LEAVVCDALDAGGLRSVVVETKPDVVVHQLTQIPRGGQGEHLIVLRFHPRASGCAGLLCRPTRPGLGIYPGRRGDRES